MKTGSFFALLRLGLQTCAVEDADVAEFTQLTAKDWTDIMAMADKQSVAAIVFDGLDSLVNRYGRVKVAPGIDMAWWQQFVYEWIGTTTQIEQKNEVQREVMDDLASQWRKNYLCVMIMKGQASGTMYPRPEHRSPGDIDCYLFNCNINPNDNLNDDKEAYRIGNDIARAAGAKVDESWYKHSQIRYRGEMFENHQYFVHTRDGKRGKRLEKELEEALKVDKSQFLPLTSHTVLPPVQWAAMFLTYHACAHFVSEGLRLKQLLDWTMFLVKHQNDVDWPQFYAYCERNHLRRFADAATAISVDYLGIKIANPAITTNSPFAEKILQSALYDDDYVFGSGEGSWHNRWHLVRNLFHYCWKYEDIYETSPWRQLWYYASGFLFKTE